MLCAIILASIIRTITGRSSLFVFPLSFILSPTTDTHTSKPAVLVSRRSVNLCKRSRKAWSDSNRLDLLYVNVLVILTTKMPEEEVMAQEETVATSDAPKVGSLNIAITSFSINTSSIDNDANISLPLWGRVVTKASDDVWVQSSNFAKSVGWAVPEGEADSDEAAAVEKFTFWPPEKSQSGPTDEETEAGEANNESWTWTNVANIMPDTVKQAMAENPDDADNAAAAAWELVLKELGENESLVSSSDVDYPVADEGSIPTRSKAIPCTAEHVTALVNTNFIIEVYKGTSRDPSTDTLVGTAIFGAEKWNGLKLEGAGDSIQRVLQYPGGVECALPVTLKTASDDGEEAQEPPLKSAPTVTVKVVADETLLQYCRGGRTFTALTSSVYLTNENGERAENVAAAWNLNDAENNSWEQEEFTIECSAPCNGSLEVSSVAGGNCASKRHKRWQILRLKVVKRKKARKKRKRMALLQNKYAGFAVE